MDVDLKSLIEAARTETESVRRQHSEMCAKCETKLELYRTGFWILAAFIVVLGLLKTFHQF